MLTPSTGISLRSPARWSRLGTDQRRARRRAATCRATPVGDPRSKEGRRGRRNRQHPRRGRRFEVSTQVHSGVGQGGRRPASLPPPRADHPNGGIPQPRRGCPLMLKNQVRELRVRGKFTLRPGVALCGRIAATFTELRGICSSAPRPATRSRSAFPLRGWRPVSGVHASLVSLGTAA